MEQSRRAVESYWRSKMVDGATSDEDKVTPVYKLEEICDLLRSSHVSIVKEVSEFIFKRLENKSPIVKQKALRLIKYAMGKSGAEFRREMQRNSVAVRQLIHYKGQPDPLKGDALNKAVRETAQETLSALFSSDESKAAPTESSLGSRIQGFGNSNYEVPSGDKKSFISGVVDIGSATIKQGLSSLTQSPSLRKNNDTGSYRSPNLRRSLTKESDYPDRYEGIDVHAETQKLSRFSKNAGSGNWGQDATVSQEETSNGDSDSAYGQKTREEKLLETIVTSGGVRLQPTRDALHIFLSEASKLNAMSLGYAIETKLRSPVWQIRMKAICVLEAVLRKNGDNFSVISSYFSDNRDVVIQCCESPQASLREKANKVLSLLGGGINHVDNSSKMPQPSVMVDLLDTGDSHDLLGVLDSDKSKSESRISDVPSTSPLIDDLFGGSAGAGDGNYDHNADDDPFADVSFYSNRNRDHGSDFFSSSAVHKPGFAEVNKAAKPETEPFDFFNSNSSAPQEHGNSGRDVNDLMGNLSIHGTDPFKNQNGSSIDMVLKHVDSTSSIHQENAIHNLENHNQKSNLNMDFASQAVGMNATTTFPLGAMGYNFPPGLMFNPAFAAREMNAMGSLLTQPQFIAAMSNYQQLQSNFSATGSHGGNSSAFPDIFNPVVATQPPTSLMNDSKREETRAFDFISDHLAAARDTKHIT